MQKSVKHTKQVGIIPEELSKPPNERIRAGSGILRVGKYGFDPSAGRKDFMRFGMVWNGLGWPDLLRTERICRKKAQKAQKGNWHKRAFQVRKKRDTIQYSDLTY
jgi:hypothetical protein